MGIAKYDLDLAGSKGSIESMQEGNIIPPARHWFFTLNNPKENDWDEIKNIIHHGLIQVLVMQDEIGESGTPHIQGTFSCTRGNKLRAFSLKLSRKIFWEKNKDTEKARMYCSDPSKRPAGGRHFAHGWNRPTEVMRMEYNMLRPWQKDIADKFKEREDPLWGRKFHWYWESEGAVGKSVLAKYFVDNHKALIVAGKNNDILYAVQQYIILKKEAPEIVVVDIPRVNHNGVSIQALESVKNGCFFSGKYEGGMVRFNSPHIIIFSNEPPYRGALSEDRWDITKLNTASAASGGDKGSYLTGFSPVEDTKVDEEMNNFDINDFEHNSDAEEAPDGQTYEDMLKEAGYICANCGDYHDTGDCPMEAWLTGPEEEAKYGI